MKAAYRTIYGPPSILQIKEIDKPFLKDNEVLIKVKTTTVNRTDLAILTANYFVIRFFTGMLKPKRPTTGTDFAGVVEVTGNKVTNFKTGDKVWGFHDSGLSSHAEYLTIASDGNILKMPLGFTFEEAVASAEAAHYAYNFFNKVKIHPGQKVMVNGGTGGIGSAAIQFLKYYGADVTATCRPEHFEIVKSIGADRLIDYTSEDFTQDNVKYDIVLDAVGKSTFGKCKRLLNPNGIYISSELGPNGENLYLPLITKLKGDKKVIFPFPIDIKRSMEFIKKLAEEGKFKPLIDKTYPLDDIKEAFEYVASGQKVGNVLVKMEN